MRIFGRKKIFIAIFAVSVIIGLVGFTFAQKRGFKGGHFADFPMPLVAEKVAQELGLSEEQKTQAKQIFEDTKTRVEPLMKTMKESREQIKDLGTDGNFDEAKVTEIANNQAETMKQLFIEKEKAKAQLFAILTPEQKEKAKEMHHKFGERMKGKFGHRFGGKEKPAPTEE